MSREISVRPRYPSTRPKTILNDSGLRLDGRSPESVRPLFLKTRVVKQARGSSYVELGSTKIICSVYGPKPLSDAEFTKSGKLACSVQYTSFSAVQRRKPHGTTKDDSKELSTRVQQSIETGVRLETFPKSVVDVNVLILEDDGSVLPAAVIAASLALASAGIEMFDLVAASSLVLVGSQFVIDPTQAEESLAAGSLSLAYMPSMKDVTDVVLMSDALDGVPAAKRTDTYVNICFEACRQIHDLMRAVLLEDAKGSQ